MTQEKEKGKYIIRPEPNAPNTILTDEALQRAFFREFDGDKNQRITKREFGKFIIKEYHIEDREKTPFMKCLIAGMFEAADGNGSMNFNDGKLNVNELSHIWKQLKPYDMVKQDAEELLKTHPFKLKVDKKKEKDSVQPTKNEEKHQKIIHEQKYNMRAKTDLFLQTIFNLIDTDGTGKVDKNEFFKFLLSLGFDVPKKEVSNLVNKHDSNSNGQLDFKEFILVMIELSRLSRKY